MPWRSVRGSRGALRGRRCITEGESEYVHRRAALADHRVLKLEQLGQRRLRALGHAEHQHLEYSSRHGPDWQRRRGRLIRVAQRCMLSYMPCVSRGAGAIPTTIESVTKTSSS